MVVALRNTRRLTGDHPVLPAVRLQGDKAPSRRAPAGAKGRGATTQVRATLVFLVTVNFRRAHLPESVSRVAIELASRTWDNWKVLWQHWIGHNARQWKAFPAR